MGDIFVHSVNDLNPPGIGKFIALDFARRGARVILACRSEARGTAALNEIRQISGNADVHLRLLDVSSMDSVREFAKRFLEEEKALHILVNNAAVSGDTCQPHVFHCNCPFIFPNLQTTHFIKHLACLKGKIIL